MDDYPSYHFPSHPCLMMHCKVLVKYRATHTSFRIILILIKTVYLLYVEVLQFCSYLFVFISYYQVVGLYGKEQVRQCLSHHSSEKKRKHVLIGVGSMSTKTIGLPRSSILHTYAPVCAGEVVMLCMMI